MSVKLDATCGMMNKVASFRSKVVLSLFSVVAYITK